MEKRTIDLKSPFGFGLKYLNTPCDEVPIRTLKLFAKTAMNPDFKQRAIDVLAILVPSDEFKTSTPPAPARKPDNQGNEYTLVYKNRIVMMGPERASKRILLDRGDTIRMSDSRYNGLAETTKIALVKGNLSPDKVIALLKISKGLIPGGKKDARNKTVDYANAMPVKDQSAKPPVSTIIAPNFVPMTSEDIRNWAHNQKSLGLSFDEDAKKIEMVEAIQKALDEVNKTPEQVGEPGGGFEDI